MADIYVYGSIGDGWGEEDMTAARFARELSDAAGEDVTIHINSAGGDVFDANAMAELVRSYRGRTTASVEGLAASAASYFALTADEVVMNPSALLMVHNPWGLCQGTAEDMRKVADSLDKVRGTIAAQYVRKTGMDEADVCALMDAETWMGAEEAVERGFVDRLTDEGPVAACVRADELARFRNAPAPLAERCSRAVGAAAGDTGSTIARSASEQPKAGSAGGEEGSSSRVECVSGKFLRHKE